MTTHGHTVSPTSPHSSPSSSSQLICVIGAKGGVGTTTVAVNLAAGLRRRLATTVLLLDWDFAGGTAALLLGVTARYSLRDLLDRPHECDSYSFLRSLSESSCGVCILPNGHEGWQRTARPATQLDLLARLAANTTPLIVADVGRAGPEATSILSLATTVILVSTPEVEAMLHASRMLRLLDSSSLQATRRLLVVNQAQQTDRPVLDETQRHLHRSIDLLIPWDESRTAEAAERGTPVVVMAASCPFSRAISRLEELIIGADDVRQTDAASSWRQRLSSWFTQRRAA